MDVEPPPPPTVEENELWEVLKKIIRPEGPAKKILLL